MTSIGEQRDADGVELRSGDGVVPRVSRGVAGAIVPDRVGAVALGDPVHGRRAAEIDLAAPVDPNFDHANFYWRMELQPEVHATAHSANTIANGALEMPENRYRGADGADHARSGARAGADDRGTHGDDVDGRAAVGGRAGRNSWFAVAEGGWKFGALSKTSPVEFAIPNRSGETVEILGRAANVNDWNARRSCRR